MLMLTAPNNPRDPSIHLGTCDRHQPRIPASMIILSPYKILYQDSSDSVQHGRPHFNHFGGRPLLQVSYEPQPDCSD